jgi:hypothetical protein
MIKIISSIALVLLTLTSCSTPDQPTTENNQGQTLNIPQRFIGNWEKTPTGNTKCKIETNKLSIIQENITRTKGTVTEDNGSTLFKADLGNGETLILLLATYNQDTPNDDVLGITITDSDTPNVYVTNGSYTRE